ncbi:hypothetical protein GINT2_001973 [Glugoides intestinalis]
MTLWKQTRFKGLCIHAKKRDMLVFILMAEINAFNLFSPSRYDFRVNPENRIYKSTGFLYKHDSHPKSISFGDLALMTLNAHIERDTIEEHQEKEILKLIDEHHPTTFSIQGLSQREFADIRKKLNGEHYDIGCTKALRNDIWQNKVETMPILYDNKALVKLSEFVFEPREYENQAYACMTSFYNNITNQVLTIVNVELSSTDEKTTDEQMYNIVKKVKAFEYKDFPIFITGTINKMSMQFKKLEETTFKNLHDMDKNNKGLDKTTFHKHGKVSDNIQRDFILLYDIKKEWKLNYSRTLSRYSKVYFERFPVFSILERNK